MRLLEGPPVARGEDQRQEQGLAEGNQSGGTRGGTDDEQTSDDSSVKVRAQPTKAQLSTISSMTGRSPGMLRSCSPSNPFRRIERAAPLSIRLATYGPTSILRNSNSFATPLANRTNPHEDAQDGQALAEGARVRQDVAVRCHPFAGAVVRHRSRLLVHSVGAAL